MKKSSKVALLCAAGVLGALNVKKAIDFVPKKEDYGILDPENVDSVRAQNNLSKAISFATVSRENKDDVDFSEFDKFHEFLEEAYPLIHKNLKKEVICEASLIYKWEGKRKDLDPIALLAHQDVVPISPGTEEDWTYPPFSGYNDGTFIWGRGALDMKNHLIGVLEAVETLLSEGFEPERDVYLLFGQDEEISCNEDGGAMNIMRYLKERDIHLDCVLDEGGAILPVNVDYVLKNKNLVGIGIGEKGYCDIKITVFNKGGHSSQAPKHNALGDLADVINDLENHQFKAEMMPFIVNLFDAMGRNCTFPVRMVACHFKKMLPVMKAVMKEIPPAASLIRTTTGVTMASGSPAPNVLPQKASIVVNFRPMPGTSIEDVVNHIKKVVRNKNIEIEVIRSREASVFSPTDSRAFNILKKLIMQEDKDNVVAPYLVMGGTDSYNYQPICENIYRYAPYKVSVDLLLTTHGTNERIPISAIEPGVAFFKRYIRKASAEV